jgi:glutamine cyclotransferase
MQPHQQNPTRPAPHPRPGLVFDRRCNETTRACKDVLYESTGIYGDSDVRLVDLGSGAVERRTKMDARWFGEGLVKRGDLLYQITW